jgi:hypothetical protein
MPALALVVALLAAPALAQDRPSEDELFGAPSTPAPEAPPRDEARDGPTPRPSSADRTGAPPPRDDDAARVAPEPGAEERLGAALERTRETLDLGGQLYLRAFLFSRQEAPPSEWQLTAPSLLDAYLDARPSDRIRAFVLGRLQYDPTATDAAVGQALPGAQDEQDPSQPLPIPGTQARRETEVLLDQLWLRFDVGRRAFVSAGKQHVKWGVGRFWNPTDFLHVTRRDPLAPFDARTGTAMLRLQVPWEERGWSFQVAVVTEPLTPPVDADAPPAGTLGALGVAARAELVLAGAELGVGGVAQRGRSSRLGIDLSSGVWELDVYGELALRSDPEVALWEAVPGADPALPVTSRFRRRGGEWANGAATIGASWTTNYGEELDTLTVGVEYAYDRNGYDDPEIYPWLLLQGDFRPFYVGRHYAGAFALLPSPGSWQSATFTGSVLGNLSDGSLVARLDLALAVLTYLRFEAFLAGHAGTNGGEFRLGLDVPPQDLGNGVVTPRVRIGAPVVDAGVALRVAL